MQKELDLVTFGEMLLRMEAPDNQRIEQSDSYNVGVTGSEMNSCVTASRLGLSTAHITKLPNNALGRKIENDTRRHGIDTSYFVWSADGRVGLYFLEFGSHPRPNAVLYDRSCSAMTTISVEEVNWADIFKAAKVFHFCATLPALSPCAAETTKEALVRAKENDVAVSFDLNYRAKLWSVEKARDVLTPLMEYVDILITPRQAACSVFGFGESENEMLAGEIEKKFDLDTVALTLRESISVRRNRWTSIGYSNGQLYDDVTYDLELVDRVGGGDAFTGGFLYAYIQYDGDIKKSIQYGNASAALKQTMPGDLNWSTLKETENLIDHANSNEGNNFFIKR